MCNKNALGNVVHTKVTKVAVEFLKTRMIFELVFLILKSGDETECFDAIDANKVVIVGILL